MLFTVVSLISINMNRYLLIIISSFFLSVTASYPAPGKALFKKVTGQVSVLINGKWIPAKVNQILEGSETIKTGNQSSAVLHHNGTDIRLYDNTVLMLNKPGEKGENSVHLQSGFSWYQVKKSKEGFSVTTPTAVASVRGTKFAVASDDRGTISCVCEGKVASKSKISSSKEVKIKKGGSHHYSSKGDLVIKSYSKYFDKKNVDIAFQTEIDKDSKLKSCLNCHAMIDLKKMQESSNEFDSDY